jgi:hypothetical protein
MAADNQKRRIVDARDVLAFVGLALFSYGAWQVYPPAAFIAVGAVMTGIAIFGVRR